MPEKSIPPITDLLGRYWEQPSISEILFDELNDYVIMSQSTFDKLANYSCSQPSGVYEGKMWRTQVSKKMCLTRTIEIIII